MIGNMNKNKYNGCHLSLNEININSKNESFLNESVASSLAMAAGVVIAIACGGAISHIAHNEIADKKRNIYNATTGRGPIII